MRFHEIEPGAFELSDGPYVFLISHGIPVAYWDRTPSAMPPGLYRTDRALTRGSTRHLNIWLQEHGNRFATLPHDQILSALDSLSRFTEQPFFLRRRRKDDWPIPE